MSRMTVPNADNSLLELSRRAGDDGLDIRLVRTLPELEPHAAAWNRLTLASPDRMPMSSHAWVASHFEHQLEPDENWLCLLAYDHSTLVGVLPAVVGKVTPWGIACPYLRAPNSNHTRSVDILAEPGREREIGSLLLSGLCCLRPRVFGYQLRRLPDSSPFIAILREGVPGISSVCDFNEYGSFIRVTGTFEDYTRRLTTKFARNLRRLGRKLDELRDVKMSFLSGKDATEKELDRFLKVEAANWKSREGSAIGLSTKLVSFYSALVHRLAAAGWLEWHFLDADGKTVAGHLGIRVGRALVLLKIGFDEAYSSYSPGNILFEKMIERAFAAGDTDEINCLTYYPWNVNWAVELRPHYDLTIFPRRPLPLVAGAMPIMARHAARRIPGAESLYHWWVNRRTASAEERPGANKPRAVTVADGEGES